MSSIKIYDNFLNLEDHKKILERMTSQDFPWYLSPILEDDDPNLKISKLDNVELSHLFLGNYCNYSSEINLIVPLIQKINPKSIIRIRAALNMKRDSKISTDAFHVDYENYNCYTAIYYLNTNNGYTEFKTGQKVESVANRFVVFDSELMHTGSFTTDEKYRALINFNYF